ncbi:putative protein-ribulosamine 3-kinase [Seiridium unicorne]|uniref:protein-ribulosamine 3-kinase n=1 Tax=Seiridium unicorne TaxID=138068 RepID=A0ABR2UV65_9PEZI
MMASDPRATTAQLDKNLLAVLPKDSEVISVTAGGLSEFCTTYRIEVRLSDGSAQVFFQKECKGQYGYDMMQACFTAESTMHKYAPEYTPRPIAVGFYESDENMHFFLAEFIEMIEDDIPGPEAYVAALVALHSRSMAKSPAGNFGFPVPTRFGDLEQTNKWEDTWEAFWTQQMKEIIDREENIRGPYDDKSIRLKEQFFSKVLPRYLRPLESNGRSVKPCLVHADLWPGNCKYKLDMETVCIYDASAFWGHNEGMSPLHRQYLPISTNHMIVDLGVFRNPRYPLGRPYLKEYWKQIPVSEPEEDADSRNNMYLLRNQILLSTLYPSQPNLRELFLANMRQLVDKVLAEEESRGDHQNDRPDRAQ